MHIRHFVFLFAFVAGCGSSHLAPIMPPITTDAGPMPAGDAGFYVWPDSGPASADAYVAADAFVAPAPIVRVVFDGPPAGSIQRGQPGNVLFAFSISSTEDVELRFLDFRIDGVGPADVVRGSAGTDLFRFFRLCSFADSTHLEGIWMGPINLPAGSPRATSSVMRFTDASIIHAGETRHFGLRADVSNTEDVPGEFFDGTHAYRVTVGDASRGLFFETAAVREVATGVFLQSDVIENDVVIAGNPQTIVDVDLLVSMDAVPYRTIAVKKQINIPTTGILLTATRDVRLERLLLAGAGNVDGTPRYADLRNVVTACALFDGDVQVGLAQTPDADSNMVFSSLGLDIPAGVTLVLTVRCTADSVVTDGFDEYNVGIAAPECISAFRTDGSIVPSPLVSTALSANATLSASNIVRVYNTGVLTVSTDNLRQSTILVAGGDVWQNFAQYRATVQYEGVDIDEVRITSRGEAASFTQVAIAVDGALYGWCILPAGTDQSCNALLDTPLHIERDSSRIFQVWGQLSNVQAGSSVMGATVGVARSGARLRLGVEGGNTVGEWDANYASSLNLRSTGLTSGDRLFAAGSSLLGNEFVVRKSKPTITRQVLSSTTIANGLDQDLYRMQISADSAGSIGVMGLRFQIAVGSSAGTISSLHMRRGSTDMAGVTIAYSGTSIVVAFPSEETIAGSGNVYTLHGVVNGFVSGDSISLAPYRDLASTIATGWVGSGLTLDTGSGSLLTGILWSDMSEIPHSYASRALGGSFDWSNDTYVEDLTRQQVLTR